MAAPHSSPSPVAALARRLGRGVVVCGVLALALLATGPATPHAPQAQGAFRLTYYHVAESSQAGTWPVYGPDCRTVLARVTSRFHEALSLEGTGRLPDGRVLNFHSRCGCARPGFRGSRICYKEVDPRRYPWGQGAWHRRRFEPLWPLRTVAVDPALVPLGSAVYVRELDGRQAPDGRLLDGCFRAADTGSLIRGRHLDLFAGRPDWTRWLLRTHGLERVTVYTHVPHCADHLRG